jgi:deoxyribodipyrimidine photo-lyase
MNEHRIQHLKNGINKDGQYVLYWMQQAQRVHYNHALMHAIEKANDLDLPVVIFFGLTPTYPDANRRHYQFMMEGLVEVKRLIEKCGMTFIFRVASPETGVLEYMKDAVLLVMDDGYLRHQKQWRKHVLNEAHRMTLSCGIDLVDSDVIVPVRFISDHAEYGAYTLRPKITTWYRDFRDFKRLPDVMNKALLCLPSDDGLDDINGLLDALSIDQTIQPSTMYHGGYLEASQRFSTFILDQGNHYIESNDPSKNLTSKMSMYLHFGQISSLELLDRLLVAQSQGQMDGPSLDAYIEQLLVRRELAFNYVTYQKGYDQFETMTEPWAYQTMQAHDLDYKPYLYSKQQMIDAKTHDVYFNAAMKEMVITGYMHNYMRMYWAKKIIEWSPSFKIAYETILSLNNTYFIDGRDPNSYAGVAWCFGKHDRPWIERTIFGKLRYMNDKGLERKFDIQKYVSQIDTYSR